MSTELGRVEERFSTRLRSATADDHADAEQHRFLVRLLGGELAVEVYADFIGQLWHLYAAMEAAVDHHRDHPVVGQVADRALDRADRLAADLAHLLGAQWKTQVEILPATGAYVERLRQLQAEWPTGLVAHHYTRYLGDLSGGQMIGPMLAGIYGLSDGPGVSWHRFESIDDVVEYKSNYRSVLDGLDLPEPELVRLTEEARVAYRGNDAIFDDLVRGR